MILHTPEGVRVQGLKSLQKLKSHKLTGSQFHGVRLVLTNVPGTFVNCLFHKANQCQHHRRSQAYPGFPWPTTAQETLPGQHVRGLEPEKCPDGQQVISVIPPRVSLLSSRRFCCVNFPFCVSTIWLFSCKGRWVNMSPNSSRCQNSLISPLLCAHLQFVC